MVESGSTESKNAQRIWKWGLRIGSWALVFLCAVLYIAGFELLRSIAVVLLLIVLLLLGLIWLAPDPKAKPFVERLKGRILR